MMKIKMALFIILSCYVMKCFSSDGKADSLLQAPKKEIQHAHIYDQNKELRIENLKRQLLHIPEANVESTLKIYNNIFEEYRSFKFDSAYVYVNKMIGLADRYHNQDKVIEGKILAGSIL